MTRLEATRVIVDRQATRRSSRASGHPAYDLFAAGDRAHEFLHVGQHGPRLVDRPRPGDGAARRPRLRPRRRRFAADESRIARDHRLAAAGESRARRDGQRGVRHDRRPGDARPRTARISTPRRARWACRATATVRTEAELDGALARTGAEAGPWVIVAKVQRIGADRRSRRSTASSSSSASWRRSARRRPRPRRRTRVSRVCDRRAATRQLAAFVAVDAAAAGRGARRGRARAARHGRRRRWPARPSRPRASSSDVIERRWQRPVPRARARRCARARATPRSPTAPPRTRSTTTTCASCRSRIRARRSCRPSLAAAEAGRRVRRARCSTPTSSASRSKARLGRLMNPRHYQRGWHCTSTLGAIGAAAARGASARAGRERRRARAGDRRVVSVGPQGELRDDGEAAARRAGGARTASWRRCWRKAA